MKKFGFTLSELIVAFGVLAVISAITLPIISGIMPDKNKTQVIKTYGLISDINRELLEDTSLNWRQNIGGSSCSDGFACLGLPFNLQYQDSVKYSSLIKYCYLFAAKMKLADDPAFTKLGLTFTTTDGTQWAFRTAKSGVGNYVVTVKFDADSTENCYYTSNCPKPDKFRFYVKKTGQVYPNDPLTNAYIKNRNRLNDRKKDFADAESDKTTYVEPWLSMF